MRCFLRKWHLWPARKATDDEVLSAVMENSMLDNDRAFQEMHEVYSKVPETNQKLKETIQRAKTPFSELEDFMHNEDRRARR